MNHNEALLGKIEVARKALGDAGDELALLLHEVRTTSRAEKTMVSRVVEDALDKLRAATAHLSDLEQLLMSDDE